MNSFSNVLSLFIKNSDIEDASMTAFQMCTYVTRVIGASKLDGIQKINGLWRVYIKDHATRLQLYLKNSILILGRQVHLHDQNPHTRTFDIDSSGERVNSANDKLTIKNVPLSVSNEEIRKMLEENKLTLVSPIRYACIRDNEGQLTSYKNGDRFVYVKHVDKAIPPKQTVCSFPCIVVHHGKMLPCNACGERGHRMGDESCPALATADTVTFKSFQHPLSVDFPCELTYVGEVFKSVQHAFLWRMALSFQKDDLAARIKNSKHAGAARLLSKEITNDERRLNWEKDNTSIMEELLMLKVQLCEPFKRCLLENQDKLLADASPDLFWGTGMSAFATKKTAANFWPGQNILGVMLTELTQKLINESSHDESDEPEVNGQESRSTEEIISVTAPSDAPDDRNSRPMTKTPAKREKREDRSISTPSIKRSSTVQSKAKKGIATPQSQDIRKAFDTQKRKATSPPQDSGSKAPRTNVELEATDETTASVT